MKHVLLIVAMLTAPALEAHAAEPLGRLFFTPAQRATLDAGKQLDLPKTAQQQPTVRGPRSLTVNGIVTRSDGESTVWVNGKPANTARPGTAPIVAKPSGNASARVRVLESDARLRVGQTLDRRTGKVTESYEGKHNSSGTMTEETENPLPAAPDAAATPPAPDAAAR
jgi:hypothetical protein